ncbi:acyl-CoA thioesterase [Maribacter sp. MAR_2009_72]|uniref:acyl-CoA thioesterase n=1 Tax=Maribacter sp. MAR_2009_72 TaxID=1250050 RepID=UPI00119A9147|nr:acyl-CoA thioesterase [Maribacter sp. MAR_2009_72]TVZ14424.1 acyl-CoA thioester hydrolase [Maribacter sp. MAR_2009_72]
MDVYRKELIVSKDDLDDLNHVNNVRYVQWIQDISKEHWQHKAPNELQEEVIWVVLSHHIEYKSAAFLNDPIVMTTFIKTSTGAKSTRIVEMIHGKTQKVLVLARTEWCLLNSKTNRPIRVSDKLKDIFL